MRELTSAESGAATLSVICLVFLGLLLLFGNARKGEDRRLLQNLVYRGYQLLFWLLAVWRAVDAGILAYYQVRKQQRILPRNERQFPMQPHELPGPQRPQAVKRMVANG